MYNRGSLSDLYFWPLSPFCCLARGLARGCRRVHLSPSCGLASGLRFGRLCLSYSRWSELREPLTDLERQEITVCRRCPLTSVMSPLDGPPERALPWNCERKDLNAHSKACNVDRDEKINVKLRGCDGWRFLGPGGALQQKVTINHGNQGAGSETNRQGILSSGKLAGSAGFRASSFLLNLLW